MSENRKQKQNRSKREENPPALTSLCSLAWPSGQQAGPADWQCQSSPSSHQEDRGTRPARAATRPATPPACLASPPTPWPSRTSPRAAPDLSHSLSLSLLPWIPLSRPARALPSPPLAVAVATDFPSPRCCVQKLRHVCVYLLIEPCASGGPRAPPSSSSSSPAAVDPHRRTVDLSASTSSLTTSMISP